MNRKPYLKPTMKVLCCNTPDILINSVQDTTTGGGGTGLGYGGGSTGPARGRAYDPWETWE